MSKLKVNQKTMSADWLDAIMHDGAIEGKARVILRNEKTGREEVIEHKNLVTNAVRNLFLYDYDRNQNLPDLIPLKKLFGGVLLFEDAFENPTVNDIMVPSESYNKFTACAGDEAHATANPYRGNPNAIASSISANGRVMTQVWEWQTSQGNGKIGSLCLTSSTAGNMGVKPWDDSYAPVNCSSNNDDAGYFYDPVTSWNDVSKKRCPVRIDPNDGQYGYTLSFDKESGILTEIKVEHPFLATSLTSLANDFIERGVRNLDLSNVVQPLTHVYYGYENGYYYVIGHNNTTGQDSHDDIRWAKISVSSFTVVASGSYIDLHALLYNLLQSNIYSWIKAQSGAIERALPICDGIAYLPHHWIGQPNEILTGLIKIPLYTGGEIGFVDADTNNGTTLGLFNRTNYPTLGQDYNSLGLYPVKVGKGLIAGDGYLLNDGVTYKTARTIRPKGTTAGSVGVASHIPHGFLAGREATFPSLHDSLWTSITPRTLCNGYAYSNMYLATINNLEEQVTKSPIMSMRVEYTLSVLS